MALYGSNVEYGLHCLLLLVGAPAGTTIGARDLAEFQGVSPTLVAKLFTKLADAGLVQAVEGVRGGFKLARPADEIRVLDVVRALEGRKPLFDCKEVRARCVLFADQGAPAWATHGRCGIHGLMLEAESALHDVLARHTLAALAGEVNAKMPNAARQQAGDWFARRIETRTTRSGRRDPGRPNRSKS